MTTNKLWPIEADPDDPNVPHATVPCARCTTHVFIAKDHPLLPDGPFFCPEHQDAPPKFELERDQVTEADLICDRCGDKLSARGTTREAAIAALVTLVDEKKWTSTFDGAPNDLCTRCQS